MWHRFLTIPRLTLFMAITGVSLCWTAPSEAAQEQRCQELGANCVCSERLESPNWSQAGGGFYDGSNLDANDKPCGNANQRHRIYSGSATPQTATGLNGFRVWRDPLNTTGTSSVYLTGSQVSALSGRVATRYYLKLGANYQSTNDGACSNDKYIQMGDYFTAFNNGFTSSAGGNFSGGQAPSNYINKWIRIEMVVDNWASPGRLTYYLKNVTDNTAEISFTSGINQFHSSGITDPIHRYRQGTCNGNVDMLFSMTAQWPSPVGTERIGAAPELEGGAPSDITPPVAPSGLTVLP